MIDGIQGKLRKTFPKSVNDCMKFDDVSATIMKWVESIEKFGTTIMWITVIAGLTVSGITSAILYELFDEWFHWFWFFFGGAAITALITVVLYIVFQFITMLFSSLASLVFNVRVNTDILIYSAVQKEESNKKAPQEEKTKEKEKEKEKEKVPDIVTDKAMLEEYKKRIDAFFTLAKQHDGFCELLKVWKKLDLGKHPVIEHVEKRIESAARVERSYGKETNRFGVVVDDIASDYFERKNRGEI